MAVRMVYQASNRDALALARAAPRAPHRGGGRRRLELVAPRRALLLPRALLGHPVLVGRLRAAEAAAALLLW